MKIIHVIEASATGTLAMCQLLSNHQAARGDDVTVIFSRRAETPQEIYSYFHRNISVVNVQMCSAGEKLFSVFALREQIKRINPSVIFLHSSFAGFLGRVALLFYPKTAKIFYIPHCISFMRKDVGVLKRTLFIAFEMVGALRHCDYIACSESEQKEIRKNIWFRKCHLVENSVLPDETGGATGGDVLPRSIITVGQIRTQKGPEQFFEIARQVRLKYPDAEFTWVGDGELELKNRLKSVGVNVTGWLKKTEVWARLRSHSIYLSTALWEGMPVSVIEAMYANVAVVANDCAGNVDVISHGVTGWLFSTTQDAVKQIEGCFESYNLDVVKAANKMAVTRFSAERYFTEMDALILK